MRSRPPSVELPERTEIWGGKCGGVGRSGEEEEAAPGSQPPAGAHGGLAPAAASCLRHAGVRPLVGGRSEVDLEKHEREEREWGEIRQRNMRERESGERYEREERERVDSAAAQLIWMN